MKDYRKMLKAIGGYENEMVAVPASGVKEIISEIELLREILVAIKDYGFPDGTAAGDIIGDLISKYDRIAN